MALRDKIPVLLKHIEAHKEYLAFNKDMFDISEGALIKHVAELIHQQIQRTESAKKMIQRIPPINIMNKIVNKLAVLYSDDVKRESNNQELVDEYADLVNEDLQEANKNLNRYKNTVIKLYEDNGTIQSRAVPSYKVLPYSDDEIDSTRVTVMIELVGNRYGKQTYWAYSDTEFIAFDKDGELVIQDMIENEGLNPFGVIPFVYRGVSKNLLIPIADYDLMAMTKLIPLLLAEVNFGAQYLSLPIIYGVDIDFPTDFAKNADTVLNLKTSATQDRTGQLSVLQPNMDIDSQIKLVKEQLDIWLTTRDIRAGTIGGTFDSDASGISLMIKNMDATKAIKAQARIFKNIEQEYWQKLAVMHNLLVDAGRSSIATKFSADFYVNTTFKDSDLIEPRIDKVTVLKTENEAGFKSKTTAIKELNPDWSQEQIDEELKLIAKDGALVISA